MKFKMMSTKSTRNGLYIVFVLLLNLVNYFLDWMKIYEMMIICCLVMVIIKLTDIENTLMGNLF